MNSDRKDKSKREGRRLGLEDNDNDGWKPGTVESLPPGMTKNRNDVMEYIFPSSSVDDSNQKKEKSNRDSDREKKKQKESILSKKKHDKTKQGSIDDGRKNNHRANTSSVDDKEDSSDNNRIRKPTFREARQLGLLNDEDDESSDIESYQEEVFPGAQAIGQMQLHDNDLESNYTTRSFSQRQQMSPPSIVEGSTSVLPIADAVLADQDLASTVQRLTNEIDQMRNNQRQIVDAEEVIALQNRNIHSENNDTSRTEPEPEQQKSGFSKNGLCTTKRVILGVVFLVLIGVGSTVGVIVVRRKQEPESPSETSVPTPAPVSGYYLSPTASPTTASPTGFGYITSSDVPTFEYTFSPSSSYTEGPGFRKNKRGLYSIGMDWVDYVSSFFEGDGFSDSEDDDDLLWFDYETSFFERDGSSKSEDDEVLQWVDYTSSFFERSSPSESEDDEDLLWVDYLYSFFERGSSSDSKYEEENLPLD